MNTKNPCINCFLEKCSKKNSVCLGICEAHIEYATTGSWTTRPEPQPVFFKSDKTKIKYRNGRIGGNSKVGKILKQLGYKNMRSLLTAFYPKSEGTRDAAEKINEKLNGISITPSFVWQHLKNEGMPAKQAGGWQGGTK